MAADQRIKRKNNSNFVGFFPWEHHRTKKKKIASPGNRLYTRDHISLECDNDRNKVIAKKEQVGLSLKHLRQFVDTIPHGRNILAEVCLVPKEIFDLENLSVVLSYEVWRCFLSEGERNYLHQFLPKVVDAEKVVQVLLDGDNFHFGNPFLDWGTAVCSGGFHPDGVLSKEERIRADKRRYYSELQKYHYEIIDYLQKLKEKWETCKDPEKDVAAKMWGRSRGGNAHLTDSRRQALEQGLTAVSEASSWGADEKLCASDSKNAFVGRTREVQKRSKSFVKNIEKEKSENPWGALDNPVDIGAKAKKRDKLPNHSTQQTDGAKYMSYLKISKMQHQIVTSMKQSGKSIQSRALNRILGNIETLDVQPYGVFVKEELKKLNAHWLQVAKDLPAAYAIWKNLQLQKWVIIRSVEGELKEKVNPWMEDEQKLDHAENPLGKMEFHMHLRNARTVEENRESLIPDQNNVLAPLQECDVEVSGNSSRVSARSDSPSLESSNYSEQSRDSGQCLQLVPSPSLVSSPNCGNKVNLDAIEEKQYSFPRSPNRNHDVKGKETEADEYSCSLQEQCLSRASPASEHCALELNNINSMGKKHVSQMANSSSVIMTEHLTDLRIPCIASGDEDSQFCSSGDVWKPEAGIEQSCIDRQAYTTGGGLAIMHNPQGEEEEPKNCFIELESEVNKDDGMKNMLQRLTNNGSFCSFPNNDQNELLQSLFKGQGMPSHNLEQLHSHFEGPHNEEHKQTMNGGQFAGHFLAGMPPPHATAQEQQRLNHSYGVSENIYCDERGMLMQRQDWNANSGQMGVIIQPQLSIGPVLSQDWQIRSVWENTNDVGYASQGSQTVANRDESLVRGVSEAEQILHRGSTSDQSLFSVLSQCSQLHHPRTTFESTSASDQFVAPSNSGMMMGEAAAAKVGSCIPQPLNPLGYLSGSSQTTSLMADDVGWMNNTHQSSALNDPQAKLYQRSRNQ
ncbi:PREDICTED: uncharacterized protein LOC104821139 isoform X2 [Tarenaya hassleriana]|uniref:uncharacterized protein LOC104821139 isoform X2 n=1 Tax=Tarenaya hassleriana TaxID=28532 RepID=UPI00053C2374|nr:PREDICTED: uncharacterized protein LOC104821139 isoform X2 [Tarenaya hassleriana]